MVIRFGVSSVFVTAALASAAVAASATAESDGRARAVIQGTGKDISVVYRAPLSSARALDPSRTADPLGEALRRKTSGAGDAAVVAYLRQNQAGLPDVVDAGTLRRLRQAGAGDSVIAEISTHAAVDIGPTSDDAVGPPVQGSDASAYGGGDPDPAGMAYPFYGSGGYGAGFYGGRGRFGNRVTHHGSLAFHGHPAFHPKQSFTPFKQPAFGKGRPMPMHVARGGAAPHRMR